MRRTAVALVIIAACLVVALVLDAQPREEQYGAVRLGQNISRHHSDDDPASSEQLDGTYRDLDHRELRHLKVRHWGRRGVIPRRPEGTVAAAAYDLNTGHSWTLGQSPPQAEASIVKVDILEALLAQSGGQGLSAANQSVAQDMIENSDNDSATDLWDAAGMSSGIGSFNSSVGLTDTTLSTCVECPGFPWPGWGLTTTVPMDQIMLLRTIVQPNSLLNNSQRQYALGLMENITPSERWGVSGGVPSTASVALKNGWLPLNDDDTDWQINSIGWISGMGRNYLLVVLTTGDPTEQYGIDTITQISSMVWQELG